MPPATRPAAAERDAQLRTVVYRPIENRDELAEFIDGDERNAIDELVDPRRRPSPRRPAERRSCTSTWRRRSSRRWRERSTCAAPASTPSPCRSLVDGDVVAEHRTFLDRRPLEASTAPPLSIALLASVPAPGPDDAEELTDDQRAELEALVDLAERYEGPLTVALPPATLPGLAAEAPALEDALRVALDGDELLSLPSSPLDPSSAVAVGQVDTFVRRLRDGEDALDEALPGSAAARSGWVATTPISTGAATMLRDLAFDLLVLDEATYGQLDGNIGGFFDTTLAVDVDLGDGGSVPAWCSSPLGVLLDPGRPSRRSASGHAPSRSWPTSSPRSVELGDDQRRGVVLTAPDGRPGRRRRQRAGHDGRRARRRPPGRAVHHLGRDRHDARRRPPDDRQPAGAGRARPRRPPRPHRAHAGLGRERRLDAARRRPIARGGGPSSTRWSRRRSATSRSTPRLDRHRRRGRGDPRLGRRTPALRLHAHRPLEHAARERPQQLRRAVAGPRPGELTEADVPGRRAARRAGPGRVDGGRHPGRGPRQRHVVDRGPTGDPGVRPADQRHGRADRPRQRPVPVSARSITAAPCSCWCRGGSATYVGSVAGARSPWPAASRRPPSARSPRTPPRRPVAPRRVRRRRPRPGGRVGSDSVPDRDGLSGQRRTRRSASSPTARATFPTSSSQRLGIEIVPLTHPLRRRGVRRPGGADADGVLGPLRGNAGAARDGRARAGQFEQAYRRLADGGADRHRRRLALRRAVGDDAERRAGRPRRRRRRSTSASSTAAPSPSASARSRWPAPSGRRGGRRRSTTSRPWPATSSAAPACSARSTRWRTSRRAAGSATPRRCWPRRWRSSRSSRSPTASSSRTASSAPAPRRWPSSSTRSASFDGRIEHLAVLHADCSDVDEFVDMLRPLAAGRDRRRRDRPGHRRPRRPRHDRRRVPGAAA